MGPANSAPQARSYLLKCVVTLALFGFLASTGCAQNTTKAQPPETSWAEDIKKYPGLPEELAQLFERLQRSVQFPAPRGESRLLPLLPQSTVAFAAIPNYGGAMEQALQMFRQELEQSAVLRDWWTHGQPATAGPKVVDALREFSELHQYLGDEIVISGSTDDKEPNFLLVSELRKPGLKPFLEQMAVRLADKSKSSLRVLDMQELVSAKDGRPAEGLVVLVRPDFVVAAPDVTTVRSFSARLDAHTHDFATTSFGRRVAQEYQGGVTVLGAADLEKILKQSPPAAKQSATLAQSGFADMQYLVWDHKNIGGVPASQIELSFTGPRHGAASWLAKPMPLGSLDFVSPKAILAGTLVLSNPAQILDDARELARLSNSNAFASIPQFEQGFKLSVKDDLLSLLGGELTFELDRVASSQSAWKVILSVKDASHLQRTLNTFIGTTGFPANHFEDGGLTYQTLEIPSGKRTTEISYAFVDGYLVVGSSRDAVSEAVELHRFGGSLAKSSNFLAALPRGHSLEASGLLYQNSVAMAAMRLRQILPGLAESLSQPSYEPAPAVLCFYGEESALREMSSNSAYDVAGALIVAAIAIPNLIRSKVAANEATAVGSVRTMNTAQVTYAATYPQRGFAPNLATLGPNPHAPTDYSSSHAGLLDESLAHESCTVDAWCTKSGYRFRILSVCREQVCKDYVVVATPVDGNSGTRNFCSTSDGVIRSKLGSPLFTPLSVAECKAWPHLQ